MLSLDDYLDAAIKEQNLSSDIALGRLLQFGTSQMSYYRTRKSLPSDGTMIKIAEFGQKDPDEALLHLNFWRAVSKNDHLAAEHYRRMIDAWHLQAA